MLTILNARRYLWEVCRELPGSWKQKKQLLRKMECSIQDYVCDNAEISYEQIKARFGDPKVVASTYVGEIGSGELLSLFHAKKTLICIVLSAAVIAVSLWAMFLIKSYLSFQKDANGYMVVEIIEVERTTTAKGE